jgi:hypothetical protein
MNKQLVKERVDKIILKAQISLKDLVKIMREVLKQK